jgi:hypothetical protein
VQERGGGGGGGFRRGRAGRKRGMGWERRPGLDSQCFVVLATAAASPDCVRIQGANAPASVPAAAAAVAVSLAATVMEFDSAGPHRQHARAKHGIPPNGESKSENCEHTGDDVEG